MLYGFIVLCAFLHLTKGRRKTDELDAGRAKLGSDSAVLDSSNQTQWSGDYCSKSCSSKDQCVSTPKCRSKCECAALVQAIADQIVKGEGGWSRGGLTTGKYVLKTEPLLNSVQACQFIHGGFGKFKGTQVGKKRGEGKITHSPRALRLMAILTTKGFKAHTVYHATSPKAVPSILANGFRIGAQNSIGKGLYTANTLEGTQSSGATATESVFKISVFYPPKKEPYVFLPRGFDWTLVQDPLLAFATEVIKV